MRSRLLVVVAFVLAVASLVPASSLAVGKINQPDGLRDLDARQGQKVPSAAQTQAVASLGARATWSRMGTPATLLKHNGFLATGIAGATAEDAARAWLSSQAVLFGGAAAVSNLELVSQSQFPDTDAYAVTFRQKFGPFLAAEDGLATVGVVGDGASWKIAWTSSSLTENTNLAAEPTLSAQAAWVIAATNVGKVVNIASILTAKDVEGWKVLKVAGFNEPQRARQVAVPTPLGGVRPAWETIISTERAGHPEAYTHFIDAVSGQVLIRKDIVRHSHPPADQFTGEVGPADGACGPDEGPWVISSGEDVGSILVQATADVPANDVVLFLERDNVTVASEDTGTSPEAILYQPEGGVPPGSYTVVVCDFVDGVGWVTPRTYTGSIQFNAAGSPVSSVARWKVFPAYPIPAQTLGHPFNVPSTDIREIWCWGDGGGCDRNVRNLNSRVPWDYSPKTNSTTQTTLGNNANSSEAWHNPLGPGPNGYRPTSSSREYVYPWTNVWYTSKCDPTQFATPGVGVDIDAAVTNLFVYHNRMHDWTYGLGFREETWNLQDDNFGFNVAGENDPVLGQAQAGAANGGFPGYLGRDNANMRTLPDGVSPITNMYLWQPIKASFYAPCVDGDYDANVIGHEYGHAVENRMIGKGGNRSGHHAGAMGESSGDLMGMEVLAEYGFTPVDGENKFAVGAYATGNRQRGIRNYGMNFSPLNFSNIGYDPFNFPSVHNDGEIWSAVNWQIREKLVTKYNDSYPESDDNLQRQCAEGLRTADTCPGNRRWAQIMFSAYLLMPVAPSMLQARDAYLAADMMLFGGENQTNLWREFAQRGFGVNATSSNGSAESDIDPKPDFASPFGSNVLFKFEAVEKETGNPITNARFYVGDYEARVSPIADTNPATTTTGHNNLDDMARFNAPRRYEMIVHAPGWGHFRFNLQANSGQGPTTVRAELSRNHASRHNAATAAGDGARHNDLIDDTEATNWEAAGGLVANRTVTLDLVGTSSLTIRRAIVSAMLLTGQSRFTALRSFEIWSCDANAGQNCATAGGYTKRLTSPANAFPGAPPRPVVPEMIIRSFQMPATFTATHIRFVTLTNQCSGNVRFQGVQDNDPANPTDCRAPGVGVDPNENPPGGPAAQDTTVRAAEVQIKSRADTVSVFPTPSAS